MSLNKIANLLERLIATGGSLSLVNTALNDANGNEIIKTTATSSAVNEFTITNAATGGSPILAPSGGDTNIGVRIQDKGTAGVYIESPLLSLRTVTTLNTASNLTYSAAQMLGGVIIRDTASADRSDSTATAAQLVAALPGVTVGQSFWLLVRNSGANTITLGGGTSVTISGTATIATNNSKLFLGVFTNVTSSSEAITLYSCGTMVH